MRKMLYALCVGTLLSFPMFQASFAQSDQGNVPPQMSPADEDSLRSAKEPTLQNILDGLGYDIDVVHDRLPTEVWEVIAGQQTQVMLAESPAGIAPAAPPTLTTFSADRMRRMIVLIST
jgi:hypothetical protein